MIRQISSEDATLIRMKRTRILAQQISLVEDETDTSGFMDLKNWTLCKPVHGRWHSINSTTAFIRYKHIMAKNDCETGCMSRNEKWKNAVWLRQLKLNSSSTQGQTSNCPLLYLLGTTNICIHLCPSQSMLRSKQSSSWAIQIAINLPRVSG